MSAWSELRRGSCRFRTPLLSHRGPRVSATRGSWSRTIIAAIVLASLPAIGFAQSAKTTLRDPVQAKRFNEISDRLVCQCGCNMVLRVCNHQNCPSAIPMRHSIEAQIGEGKDDDAIVAGFVAEHGTKVLSSPPAEGLNLAAWVMPGFALGVGLFAAWYFAVRWAAKRKLAAAGASEAAMDPALRARIEDELRGS